MSATSLSSLSSLRSLSSLSSLGSLVQNGADGARWSVRVRSFVFPIRSNERTEQKRVSGRVISNGYAQLVGSVGSVGRMGRVSKREHHLSAQPCRALDSINAD